MGASTPKARRKPSSFRIRIQNPATSPGVAGIKVHSEVPAQGGRDFRTSAVKSRTRPARVTRDFGMSSTTL